MKFYNLMPIALQSQIRNLLSASYFNFDLFHVSPILVVFNIFCSHRLILVHLFWKSRGTLSDYVQKMNKLFVTFPHIHSQKENQSAEGAVGLGITRDNKLGESESMQ